MAGKLLTKDEAEELWSTLHKLWSAAVGTPNYDKRTWGRLESFIINYIETSGHDTCKSFMKPWPGMEEAVKDLQKKVERMGDLKKAIIEITDEASGGIKGIELLTKLIERKVVDHDDRESIDLDNLSNFVEAKIPEMGVLQYGMKLDETMDRVKYFFYRKLGAACQHTPVSK